LRSRGAGIARMCLVGMKIGCRGCDTMAGTVRWGTEHPQRRQGLVITDSRRGCVFLEYLKRSIQTRDITAYSFSSHCSRLWSGSMCSDAVWVVHLATTDLNITVHRLGNVCRSHTGLKWMPKPPQLVHCGNHHHHHHVYWAHEGQVKTWSAHVS
jgi:hypothetical protein